MSRGMLTSIDTVTQVSIKFREKTRKKVNKNMDIRVKHNTYNTYENGIKCARIWERREIKCVYMI